MMHSFVGKHLKFIICNLQLLDMHMLSHVVYIKVVVNFLQNTSSTAATAIGIDTPADNGTPGAVKICNYKLNNKLFLNKTVDCEYQYIE